MFYWSPENSNNSTILANSEKEKKNSLYSGKQKRNMIIYFWHI